MPNINIKPALLGGVPEFREMFSFNKPTLPGVDELMPELKEIFASGAITNGKYVRKFEEKTAEYLGVKNAVALSSCTAGLMLTYRILGLSGEVIVPSFTFSATVQALVWNNIRPVLCDCDPYTFNIDVDKAEKLITDRTTAIVAVHVFGMPAEVEGLESIANNYKLKLVYDSAHAFGSIYEGKKIGGFGDAEVFSLSPTKLLVAGEGGIVATNDDQLAKMLKMGRDYANPGDYNCQFPGLNARMTEFNALLALKNLETIENKVRSRNQIANVYKLNLYGIPGISFQEESVTTRSTYKDFSILISADEFGMTRDEFSACLKAENIMTRNYYYPAVHAQKFFTSLYGNNVEHLKVTERVSKGIISLPIYSHMEEKDVVGVCRAIRKIHTCRAMIRDLFDKKLIQSKGPAKAHAMGIR